MIATVRCSRLVGTLGAVGLCAAVAGTGAADSTVVADPSARNVTIYIGTSAWSRKAADGYRLVIARGGVVVDAPVPPSRVPYDPDLGPTVQDGRKVAAVYARDGDL